MSTPTCSISSKEVFFPDDLQSSPRSAFKQLATSTQEAADSVLSPSITPKHGNLSSLYFLLPPIPDPRIYRCFAVIVDHRNPNSSTYDPNRGFEKGGLIDTQENSKYDGDFFHGLRHGKGKIIYQNGTIFIGDFFLGQPHGEGTFFYNNGSTYVGPVSNGLPHGKNGTFTLLTGKKYIGSFSNGYIHGPTTVLFFNEINYINSVSSRRIIKFEATYKNGTPEGNAKFTFVNGDTQEGVFINRKFCPKPLPIPSQLR